MNKNLLIISIIFFLTSSSFAQTPSIKTNDEAVGSNDKTTMVLKLNISGYDLFTIESLKEELMAWNEKISSVDINESTKEFTLVHFLTLENRELYDVLKKHNIQKNSIISYK